MMPIPFIKVAVKEFKRNLRDNKDGTATTSSTNDDTKWTNTSSAGLSTVASSSGGNINHENVCWTAGDAITIGTLSSSSFTKSSSDSGSASEARGSTHSGLFLFRTDLDPEAVMDHKTGKPIFSRSERDLIIKKMSRENRIEPHDLPSLAKVPEEVTPPVPKQDVAHAEHACVGSARSPVENRSSRLARSNNAPEPEEVKSSALQALKISKLIIARMSVVPLARKIAGDWQSFQSFRARSRAARRSKTLAWFEDRAEATKRAEEEERQRQHKKQRKLRRNLLKKERASQQARQFLTKTRAEFKRVFDIKYATSLEQEKARNYFLESNDRWQAQALARQIEDDEEDRRRREENAEADKVREGDERRKAAAAEHLAEYDRGEELTQELLRVMRRAGFIPGVNAPPTIAEAPPLETDSYLLLRLRSGPHRIGVVERSRGSGGGSCSSDLAAERRNGIPQREATRRITKLSPPGERGSRKDRGGETTKIPLPSPKPATESWSRAATVASGSDSLAQECPVENPRRPQQSSPFARAGGGHKRGRKKQSSGAFEVDLLRFRSVEEMRGWKLGSLGGESLAADLSNGACPRLKVLRLAWCSLADRGTRALVRALGGVTGAAGRTLQELELRGNAITAVGGGAIWAALDAGVLPALRTLDLGDNFLGDNGGRALAHCLLAGCGTWPQLVVLDLSSNDMGDGGVEAVFKAATAPGAALSPEVERISLRFNRTSRSCRERTARPPRFLVV